MKTVKLDNLLRNDQAYREFQGYVSYLAEAEVGFAVAEADDCDDEWEDVECWAVRRIGSIKLSFFSQTCNLYFFHLLRRNPLKEQNFDLSLS